MSIPTTLIVLSASTALFLIALRLGSYIASDEAELSSIIYTAVVCGLFLTGITELSVISNYNDCAENVEKWKSTQERELKAEKNSINLSWQIAPIADATGKQYPRVETINLPLETAYLLGVIKSPEFQNAKPPSQNRWKLLLGLACALAGLGALGIPRRTLEIFLPANSRRFGNVLTE